MKTYRTHMKTYRAHMKNIPSLHLTYIYNYIVQLHYVDMVVDSRRDIPRDYPRFFDWTTNLLNSRQNKEKAGEGGRRNTNKPTKSKAEKTEKGQRKSVRLQRRGIRANPKQRT